MPCECINWGYSPDMGEYVEGHHPRCPHVPGFQPGPLERIMSEKVQSLVPDDTDEEEAGIARRSYAPDLRACHQIDGIMEKLEERLRQFVVARMVAKYGKAE